MKKKHFPLTRPGPEVGGLKGLLIGSIINATPGRQGSDHQRNAWQARQRKAWEIRGIASGGGDPWGDSIGGGTMIPEPPTIYWFSVVADLIQWMVITSSFYKLVF